MMTRFRDLGKYNEFRTVTNRVYDLVKNSGELIYGINPLSAEYSRPMPSVRTARV